MKTIRSAWSKRVEEAFNIEFLFYVKWSGKVSLIRLWESCWARSRECMKEEGYKL